MATEPRDRSEAARAVTRLSEESSKFRAGSCEDLGKESIKCIEEHGFNRNDPACQVHFQAYKKCRQEGSESKKQQRKFKSFFFG